MTTIPRTSTSRATARDLWHGIPAGFKGAVVAGVLGWFLFFTDSGRGSLNGEVLCWNYDHAKVVLGGLSVLLAAAGVVRWWRGGRSLPAPLVVLLTLALLVNGTVLVLRGSDIYPSVCAALGA